MLDLVDLTAFAYIAELGSISGAARSLKMPKSSVSRSLARLEGSVGAVLIERSTRHLRLTDAGLLMQRHARRILDDVGEAENAIGGLIGTPGGDLHINAPFTFASGPLASMLPAFTARFPQVRVVLTVENRPVDLQIERADIAIRMGPLQNSDLIARRLTTFELWPCASPGYLNGREAVTAPKDLLRHRLIAHADRREIWQLRTAAGAVRDIEVEPGIVIPEPDVLKTMLIADAGIGLLPDFHAADAIADGRLIRLLPDFKGRAIEANALYHSHRSLSAKVRVFIDALVAHFALSL
jgi:DNA-binding transcriptional LysR family regulator